VTGISPGHRVVSFATGLAGHGDAPALVTDDGVLTFRELAERVADVARRLGTERRLVLLAGGNAVDPIVTYLAALSAGHPLLLAPGGRALEGLAEAYDPDVVVSDENGWQLDERREVSAHDLHPELALMLSTSGSTGSPKLVRLSHENLDANADAIATYLDVRASDRAITTLPLHYCYGLSVVNSYLSRGASLVLSDLSVVDQCFWRIVQRERVTSFAGVPYTFELLERVGFAEMELPHLRYVTQAGGRMPPERVSQVARLGRERGWELFVMYGATEATARMAYLPPALAVERPQTIGVPIPGGSFAIEPVDGWDEPGVGELVYSGPNVMLGYAETPEELALGRTVEALRTGDMARLTDDGLHQIVGRRARFVKVLGLRIDLSRAETVLAEQGIQACCVSAHDDELAVVHETTRDPGEIRRIAAAEFRIPPRAVRVIAVDSLPRLSSGKPDYPAVTALARAAAAAEAQAPEERGSDGGTANDPEALRALFAEVLDRPEATLEDTFVTLGGDSLSYVEASTRLEQALGHLPPSWHVTPIGELKPVGERRFGGRAMETSVVVRALAIVLVVSEHARLFVVFGGASVLLAVAGFNFARFQIDGPPRMERLRSQLLSIARIVVPTLAWIVFAAIFLTDKYGVETLTLTNTIFGPNHWTAASHYWFIEALLYMLLLSALLLAIPPADRAERRWPWGFAAALVAIGLLSPFERLGFYAVDTGAIVWLFALGWLVARSSELWQRAIMTALILVAVPAFFSDLSREVVSALGLLALVWIPSVPRIPSPLARAMAVLASASLYIYLVHWAAYQPFDRWPLIAVLASLATGVVYWKIATPILRHLIRTPAPARA
jgi:acyl-CoA synthetase (AMP-forming)/AMP-acid ligase II